MVENVIQIKIEITINVNVSAEILQSIICMKKFIFRILVHGLAKMLNI